MITQPTICIISFALLVYHTRAFMKNNYLVNVENVEVCPNNDKLAMPIKNVKFVPYNRTQKVLSFDVTYDRPLDENVGGSVEIDKWGDGGWKSVPFIGYQPYMCKSMITYFKPAWTSMHLNAGVKHPDRCPTPPGNYSIRNFVIETNQFSIPFWSGRFRFKLMYVDAKTKDPLYCWVYYINISEKF